MSWGRPTILVCDADGCHARRTFWAHELGQKPRGDGYWPFASVPLSRKRAGEEGWTTRREECEGEAFTADYCPEHST